jgi:hypothetical protein
LPAAALSLIPLSAGANLTVTKKCVLSPCFLDQASNKALSLESKGCDMGADSFTCIFCCKDGDGCNGAVVGNGAHAMAVAVAATLAVSLQSYWCLFTRNI